MSGHQRRDTGLNRAENESTRFIRPVTLWRKPLLFARERILISLQIKQSSFFVSLVSFVPLFPRAERAQSIPLLLTLGSEVVAGWQVGVITYLHRVEAEILLRGICEGDHRLEGQPATKAKRDGGPHCIIHLSATCSLLAALEHSTSCRYMVCFHWALSHCWLTEAYHFNALHLHN